jgi:hypothetical protein
MVVVCFEGSILVLLGACSSGSLHSSMPIMVELRLVDVDQASTSPRGDMMERTPLLAAMTWIGGPQKRNSVDKVSITVSKD